MKQPSLDTLMSQVDSKYTLVVVAAKRARVLIENSSPEDTQDVKPVSRALDDMAHYRIRYEMLKETMQEETATLSSGEEALEQRNGEG